MQEVVTPMTGSSVLENGSVFSPQTARKSKTAPRRLAQSKRRSEQQLVRQCRSIPSRPMMNSSILKNAFLVICIALPSGSSAQQKSPKCVTQKSMEINGKSVFVGTNVFFKPGDATPFLVVRMSVSLWAIERRGKWLLLAGASNSHPFQEDTEIGWALESELSYIYMRNCN